MPAASPPSLQSQLDFRGLGGDLLLEMGSDPLGLLSPLVRQQQQAPPPRPGSGLSTARPALLVHGAPASSTAAPRLASAPQSSLGQQASSMPARGRRSDGADTAFLRSPGGAGSGGMLRVPALFKSPAAQAGLAPATHSQHPPSPRRGSLFSPVAFSAPHATAKPCGGKGLGGGAPAGSSMAQSSSAAPGAGGRNLVTVQSGRLDTLDR